VLSETAERVEAHYVRLRCRCQHIASFNPSDEKYGAFWESAAKSCDEFKIIPEQFVEVQFDVMKPYPYINALKGKKAVTNFFNHQERFRKELVAHVQLSVASVKSAISAGLPIEDYIVDPDNNFDDLFIYTMLLKYGFKESAEKYKDFAREQYESCAFYGGIYKKSVPEDWSTYA